TRRGRSPRFRSAVSPLAKLVESALFASARPLTVEELVTLDPQSGAAAVRGALAERRNAFATGDHGVELVEIAQGWQFLTRREYAEAIDRAQFALRPRRLSPAALETLAIIAYRQPVGRVEVDEIRGVDSGAVIEKLSARGLAERGTRGQGLGRAGRASRHDAAVTQPDERGATQMERYRAKHPPEVEWEVGEQTGKIMFTYHGVTFTAVLGRLDTKERTNLLVELETSNLFEKMQ